MAEAKVYDAQSGESSTLSLSGPQFESEPRNHVIHRAVVTELDARRRYTASTKGRVDVTGSGAKLYRQKGTGRARAGDIKPPNRVGGGTWGGPSPKPDRYGKRINRKEARAAFFEALSDKAGNGNIHLVDSLSFDAPSTKRAKEILSGMGVEGRTLLVVTDSDQNAELSFRNLPEVELVYSGDYGVYEVMRATNVVFSREAYDRVAAIGQRRAE
ncbi:50S ribosomal protein L4 [Rubrobacter aplysinae]|uniref:50S ribosomal protein L4 n=1 Tax=Rubrobacter aplysinae TaxID=909625 RepID=UPI00064BD48D|nr:50S ribosomal protein L4 [Rubrobacter aplysinae]